MTENGLRESILVADCGRVTTRVALLDMVEGRYRFVARGEAPSTGDAPWSDITAGLVHAVAKVEAITGRQIIGEQEGSLVLAPAEPNGVDLMVASTSAAPAPKTVLVGLMDVMLSRVSWVSETTIPKVIRCSGSFRSSQTCF